MSIMKLLELMMFRKIIISRVHKSERARGPCHGPPSFRMKQRDSHRIHFRNFIFWIFTNSCRHIPKLFRIGQNKTLHENLRTFTAISSYCRSL
jgi:hypothetical protein